MKFGWIGFHLEGVSALRAVVERGYSLEGVLTLTPAGAAPRSGAADYAGQCRQLGLTLFEIDDVNGPHGLSALRKLDLDIAFVIGWTQLVRPAARSLVRVGMIGAHASLLPDNRGRAPVNWALVNGEARTGNTLMWLTDEVDGGDVIDQTVIPISAYDTCASLYERVAESNRDMILRLLPRLLRGERPGSTQPATGRAPLPRRRPEDGCVDWSLPSNRVYNLVRAVTRPYPGAFSWLSGRRWLIWRCALLPGDATGRPGEVLGPVYSPAEAACGQVVQCGRGQVVLLEVEDEGGDVVHGHRLSEQRWTGRSWWNG